MSNSHKMVNNQIYMVNSKVPFKLEPLKQNDKNDGNDLLSTKQILEQLKK